MKGFDVTAQSPQGVAVGDWWPGRWIPAAARVGRRPDGRRRAGEQACKTKASKTPEDLIDLQSNFH